MDTSCVLRGSTALGIDESKLSQLQEKLGNVVDKDSKLKDPAFLGMWLKNCCNNVERADTKIRASVKWRLENGLDDLAKADFHPRLRAEIPLRFDSVVTHSGHRVITVFMGGVDYVEVIEKHGKEKFFTFWRQLIAKTELDEIKVNGRNLNKSNNTLTSDSIQASVIIMDAKNFSLKFLHSRQLIEGFLECARDTLRHYACNNTVIFLNVGPLFRLVLKLFIPILATPSTTIEVYGTDEEQWKRRLASYFNVDEMIGHLNISD